MFTHHQQFRSSSARSAVIGRSLLAGRFPRQAQTPAAPFDRMFEPAERAYLSRARVGRLATADADGRPHVVPMCFALVEDCLVSAIDEKPQRVGPRDLRRVHDVRENPRVAVVVDHYSESWADLGWVQVRGTARIVEPGEDNHGSAVTALRKKYSQYDDHDLEDRPLLEVEPGSVRSWGALDATDG
jgi:PPOX class probable F420-dependent enzyme